MAETPDRCDCGVVHRSETAAAKCRARAAAAPRIDAAAPDAEVTVDVDDLVGCIGLMDGRLVRVGATGVLAVSPSFWQGPPLPRQIAHQNDVVRLAIIVSGEPVDVVVPALNAAIRSGRAVTTVLRREVLAEVADELTRVARREQMAAAA